MVRTSQNLSCPSIISKAAEAVKQCSEAIRIREEEEPRLYCDRAEAYLDDDMYDEVKFPNGQA